MFAVIYYVLSVSSRPMVQINYSQNKVMLTTSSCMFGVTIRPGLSGHVLFLGVCPGGFSKIYDLSGFFAPFLTMHKRCQIDR